MRTHVDSGSRLKGQRLADLKSKAEELERKLSDARVSLERELAQFSGGREAAASQFEEPGCFDPADLDDERDADIRSMLRAAPGSSHRHGRANPGSQAHSPRERTEVLVNQGRRTAYARGLSLRYKVAIGTAGLAALITILVMVLSSGGASWPSSVAVVQSETARACQNPNVKSEPGQVNFACAKGTRQILWVFALMTSAGNPGFAAAKTGRIGLEPITPTQGGELAWSLNLHHPYNPSNPIDSLEVAARAINNIIGGATLTGTDGNPVVQSGLESSAANCARYTGSAAVTSRKGFPGLCARPVTSQAGQAALVADVYRKWVVGAGPAAVRAAAVLFENASNPADPQVQAILKHLSRSRLLA